MKYLRHYRSHLRAYAVFENRALFCGVCVIDARAVFRRRRKRISIHHQRNSERNEKLFSTNRQVRVLLPILNGV